MQENNISANNFEQCVKCSICVDACPLSRISPAYPGPKQAGPDGERLRLKDASSFDKALKMCLNCKRCEVACPSDVNIAGIIQNAREKYGHQKPSLRDRMLASTDLMGSLARPVAPLVNAITAAKPVKAAMHSLMGIDHRRIFPKYSSRGFESWFRREAEEEQRRFDRQVSYFHGCYVEYNNPQLGRDFVKVMNALGYGVRLLESERCCGVAMISAGMFDAARRNAEANLASIRSAGKPVLTTSTTCTLTIREEYGDILGLDAAAARENLTLALKFIYEAVERGDAVPRWRDGFHARVAYHAPCHMVRLGWEYFSIELLRMIPGLELVELPSNCCGIAGTYGFKKENYDNSQAIGKPLFEDIARTAPDYVACECETCKWQIEMSTGFEVRNPISILAEALAG